MSQAVRFDLRLSEDIAQRLERLARATGRPRAHIVRVLLATADEHSLPPGWIAAAETERVAGSGERPAAARRVS